MSEVTTEYILDPFDGHPVGARSTVTSRAPKAPKATCQCVLTRGINSGNLCDRPATRDSGLMYCRRHYAILSKEPVPVGQKRSREQALPELSLDGESDRHAWKHRRHNDYEEEEEGEDEDNDENDPGSDQEMEPNEYAFDYQSDEEEAEDPIHRPIEVPVVQAPAAPPGPVRLTAAARAATGPPLTFGDIGAAETTATSTTSNTQAKGPRASRPSTPSEEASRPIPRRSRPQAPPSTPPEEIQVAAEDSEDDGGEEDEEEDVAEAGVGYPGAPEGDPIAFCEDPEVAYYATLGYAAILRTALHTCGKDSSAATSVQESPIVRRTIGCLLKKHAARIPSIDERPELFLLGFTAWVVFNSPDLPSTVQGSVRTPAAVVVEDAAVGLGVEDPAAVVDSTADGDLYL